MEWNAILIALLIALARVADVSIGTIRTISVVQGRALTAWVLGFFEVLIWLFAITWVMNNLNSPLYAVFYCLGFATGNYVGIRIEARLAFGTQVVRVFSKLGQELTAHLRSLGYRVTVFDGERDDGHVHLLFIEVKRRETSRLLSRASEVDPHCYYLVDDIRFASQPAPVHAPPTGWRAVPKKK